MVLNYVTSRSSSDEDFVGETVAVVFVVAVVYVYIYNPKLTTYIGKTKMASGVIDPQPHKF